MAGGINLRKKSMFMLCLVIIAVFVASIYLYNGLFNKPSTLDKKSTSSTFAFKNTQIYNIAIIGDSLAKGTGDEKGSGFATYLPEYLKSSDNENISIYNGGVNGLKSSELIQQLKSAALDSQISGSDLIVVSIGGNDLLNLINVSDNEKLNAFKDTQNTFSHNLKDILSTIREKNPNAILAFTGLYNPREDSLSSVVDIALNKWNNSAKEIIEQDGKSAFIETDDLFKSDLKDYISADTLHPNSAGYEAVSKKIAQLINP